MASAGKILGFVCMVVLLAGCTKVISGDAGSVSVDTGDVGKIAPGTREWLSWLQARDHCAKFAKVPEIADLKGAVASYKCVPKK
jgi:hypothetical protein